MALTTLTTQRLVRIVNQGDNPGVIINRDLTNSVVYGFLQGIDPLNEGSLIDPLTYAPYDGTTDIWAAAVTGTATVDVSEGRTNYVPSPAQQAQQLIAAGLAKDTSVNNPSYGPATASGLLTVNNSVNAPGYGPITTANAGLLATQATLASQTSGGQTIATNISNTGAPALNLKSTNQAASTQTITAGTTAALTSITGINQPAYNLHFTATAGASSTKPWYTVVLKWVDTASGFTVQSDAFTFFMSGTSNVMSGVIYGQSDADQLQISVTNNDTVTMTLNLAFFVLSSRTNYTVDQCYQFWTTASMPTIPTFQNGPATPLPTQKIIFSVNRSVGIGVTTTPDYSLPVFSGQAFVHFDGTGSNNWDVEFTDQLTGTFIHRQTYTGAPALGNVPVILPRAPVTCHITNNGSVLGQASLEVTAL